MSKRTNERRPKKAAGSKTDRPAWLTGPCPDWCDGIHGDHEMAADRMYYSPERTVQLHLVDMAKYSDDDWQLEELRVYLQQHVQWAEPVVMVGIGDVNGLPPMSLDEATELVGKLIDALDMAGGHLVVNTKTRAVSLRR